MAITEKVYLIPWDQNNQGHYDRMYTQRIACGWRQDDVPGWKKLQTEGGMMMYWIVSCAMRQLNPS
jgi:hypothetical protein